MERRLTREDLIWPKLRKLPPSAKKILGKRYGSLVVFGFAGLRKTPDNPYVECMCDCGEIVLVSVTNVSSGNSKSCGCKRSELVSKNKKKHGYAGSKGKEKIYITWRAIRDRCYNNNSKAYPRYGGRGIVMCNGWGGKNGFLSFAHDLLPITDISLDRIDNDGNYSCGHCDECKANGWTANCRWADAKTQASNKSNNSFFLIKDKKVTVSEAARILGINLGTLATRRKNGWSDEKIINTPPRIRRTNVA